MKPLIFKVAHLEGRRLAAQVRETHILRFDMIRTMETLN
jgi:hypothetical protein